MNKCSCGAEFEGKFCPQCGTPVKLAVCAKCGTEYDGNFCPNCGAPKQRVCPRCGWKVGADANFCKNCGFALGGQSPVQPNAAQQYAAPTQQYAVPVQQNVATPQYEAAQQTVPAQQSIVTQQNVAPAQQTATQQKSAQQNVDWKQNKTLRTVFLYAPLVIFSLWAVLLWAFMAAPMLPPSIDMFGMSIYTLLTAGATEASTAFSAAAAFMAFAAISTLYAVLLAVLQLKRFKVARLFAHYASLLLYVVIIVLTSVLSVEMMGASSAFVGATLALTVVLFVTHVAALVMCKLLKISTITPENREHSKFFSLLKDLREYSAYKKELKPYHSEYKKECRLRNVEYKSRRKLVVMQEIKANPFRNVAAGIVSACSLAMVLIGIVVSIPGIVSITSKSSGSYARTSDMEYLISFIIIGSITLVMSVLTTAFSFTKHWRTAQIFSAINFVASVGYTCIGISYGLHRSSRHVSTPYALFVLIILSACLVFALSFASLMVLVAHNRKMSDPYKNEYDEQTISRNEPTERRVVRHLVVCKNMRATKTTASTKVFATCHICVAAIALVLSVFSRNPLRGIWIGALLFYLFIILAFSFACVTAYGVLKHKKSQVDMGWVSMVFSLLLAAFSFLLVYIVVSNHLSEDGTLTATIMHCLTFVFYFVSAVISAYFALTSIAGPFCACLREYNATTPYEITDFDETQDDDPIE